MQDPALSFAQRLIAWQRRHGRHHLPWQCDDPYRIWLSEIMLQQTQVATVIPYYQRFLDTFPNVMALADAPADDIMALWSGLGYYSRARNLHHAAKQVRDQYGGRFPQSRAELEKLKGVGRSTAAAIAVFAYGAREAILDGNVKRILLRHAGLDADPAAPATLRQLWRIAEARLPESADDLRAYTQGLMDLGASHCARGKPQCHLCPLAVDCHAYRHDLTAVLPRKKSRASKPEKDGYFLLVRNARGDAWLTRRAERGIWGGLYCLPWFESLQALHDFARQHGLPCPPVHTSLTHHFTHYTLHLHLVDGGEGSLPLPFIAGHDNLGLPAPIRSLLGSRQQQLI
ncbi:MAG: A/G-specific adenine glycosylase [Cardiobacteriaceae bacterium]|nr:A/G-specific adenine glycosylase [Cardiobacteriaceae bacterium]